MLSRRSFSGLLAGASAAAADWPQWRGAARDGRAADTGLLRQWPAKGPDQLWRVDDLGAGYSSFSVAGGKLFTQSQNPAGVFRCSLDLQSIPNDSGVGQ